MRNDNLTNFAYVGTGIGITPPEQYVAYRPANNIDPTPIQPGETTIFKNQETRKWCRLAPFTPSTTCLTQGMLCDQDSPGTATVFTYTGTGLQVGGVPMVQEATTGSLVLTSEPTCSDPGGEKLVFPPGRPLPYCCCALLVCKLRGTTASHHCQWHHRPSMPPLPLHCGCSLRTALRRATATLRPAPRALACPCPTSARPHSVLPLNPGCRPRPTPNASHPPQHHR